MLCKAALLVLLAAVTAAGETRYRFGDDPRWAEPGFDDRDWQRASPMPILRDKQFDTFWARSRVPMPRDAPDQQAILWPADCSNVGSAAELFINGVRVARLGTWQTNDVLMLPPNCVFPIPAGLGAPGQYLTVAVRARAVYHPPVAVTVGRRDLLEERAQTLRSRLQVAWSIEFARGVFLFLLGIALLTVWKMVAGDRALFWFGVWLLFEGSYSAIDAFQLMTPGALTRRETNIIYLPLNIGELIPIVNFVWALYSVRVRWLLQTTQILIVVSSILGGVLAHLSISPHEWVTALNLLNVAPLVVLAGIAVWGLRRRGDGRMVGLGLLALAYFYIAPALPPPFSLPSLFTAGPFTFYTVTVGMTLFAVGVAILLWRRAWSNWRSNERTKGEIAAAREIQSRLIPVELPAIDGFRLDASFFPAEDVGGDFYQILPAEGGAALLVVGDVSGKGLKAAMVVASIVGALKNEFSRGPAEVLKHLNRTLAGQMENGFVTCCAALLNNDGMLRIANAGHIAPYLNGRELSLEAGLPLGIEEAAEYSETPVSLSPGDHLAFVSDGVVEARNRGGDLFGFERTSAVASRGAAEIAAAARAFGQEDDITAITIDRLEAVACASF